MNILTNVGFVSLGCSKNLIDTENMMGILKEKGYGIVSEPENADIIVVNTCGFIDSAKEESIEALLDMARFKEGRCRLLVAAGCLAQRYGEEIKKELPEVDVIVGTGSYASIAEAVEEAEKKGFAERMGNINFPLSEEPRILTTPPYTAFIKIAEGCDRKCTYCAIPSIRGEYRSRPMEAILAEAEKMAAEGVREIILVAQDTTLYGVDLYGEKKLPELLHRLCKTERLKWVRVHYCYPEDIGDELISAFKNEEKLVKYLDIPVQHGCDSVLRRMGRRTSGEEIASVVRKLRKAVPDITLRTSIIVGFPGETEEEFEILKDFVREVKFDRMGVFAYSREEGTAAARMRGQVNEEVKEKRREEIMLLAREISLARNKGFLGRRCEVLVEGFDENQNLYFGRSGGESVEVDPKIYFGSLEELEEGQFVRVRIIDCDEYDLYGRQEEEG